LKAIDLSIASGEFVVLVGPSGCGKSTLLRLIAGLEALTSGTIRIGGAVVNDLPPKDRDIAMVFQSYALYPHMTVRDNMSYSLRLKRVAQDKIAALVKTRRQTGHRGVAGAQAAPSLWRPTPTRGDGPRHRAQSQGVSV